MFSLSSLVFIFVTKLFDVDIPGILGVKYCYCFLRSSGVWFTILLLGLVLGLGFYDCYNFIIGLLLVMLSTHFSCLTFLIKIYKFWIERIWQCTIFIYTFSKIMTESISIYYNADWVINSDDVHFSVCKSSLLVGFARREKRWGNMATIPTTQIPSATAIHSETKRIIKANSNHFLPLASDC